jgi:hypothetical protein
MDFPDFLPLKVLEMQHPSYAAIAPTLGKIDDLSTGGHQLEAKKAAYLRPRPGEEPDLYRLRLDKFTYSNILGQAIAQQASKLSGGDLSISGIEKYQDFWSWFREHTNQRGRSEKDLIGDSFRTALKFKSCYWHIEKPYSEFAPQTRQQEEMLGMKPYVCAYTPLEATNWEESDDGLIWLKVRQLKTKPSPFGKALTQATWTFITDTYTAKYQAFVKLNAKGAIAEILNPQGESIDSGEDANVFLFRLITHGVGRLPVLKLEVPDDLWVTNQAYLKAMEYLRLENSRSDTAEMVGYVQRTYKPFQRPDTDLDHTFVDAPDDLKTGNQYVIRGDFAFNEATGASLTSVGSVLQEIRDAISDMVGMGRASATKGAVEQSGISKKMDYVTQELVLKAYGAIVCDRYQDLLQMVGRVAGFPPAEVEAISVTGLNSFDVDSLETLLAIAIEAQPILPNLPPTVVKLFYGQLSNLLVKNASAEQQAVIQQELDQIFSGVAA